MRFEINRTVEAQFYRSATARFTHAIETMTAQFELSATEATP